MTLAQRIAPLRQPPHKDRQAPIDLCTWQQRSLRTRSPDVRGSQMQLHAVRAQHAVATIERRVAVEQRA